METKEFERILLYKDSRSIESDISSIKKICKSLTKISEALLKAESETKTDLHVFGLDEISNINNMLYFNPKKATMKQDCGCGPNNSNSEEIVVNSISDYVKKQMALNASGNFGGLMVSKKQLFDFIVLPDSVKELEIAIGEFRDWLKTGRETVYMEYRSNIEFDGKEAVPQEGLFVEIEEAHSRFTSSEEENARFGALVELKETLNKLAAEHRLKLSGFDVEKMKPGESMSYGFDPMIVLSSNYL